MDHPGLKLDKVALFDLVFDKLSAPAPTTGEIEDIIESLRQMDLCTTVADAALKILDGKKSRTTEDIIRAVEEYQKGSPLDDGDGEVENDLDDLLESTYGLGGLSWRLKELNEILGPLRVGDFIVLFARPETGKTTFLCSEATHMAGQMEEGKKVLWFNNEEKGKKVLRRIYQAALGHTILELGADKDKSRKAYTAALGGDIDRIIVFDKSPLTRGFIDAMLKKYDAGLIIIDRVDKVRGFDSKGKRDDLRLGDLTNWSREVSKEYAPLIGVMQADGSAEGQKFLTKDQIFGSKTLVQGECDALIGIGSTPEPGFEYSRFFNIPRNKLDGDKHTNEARRHGLFEAVIDPERARYKD